MSNEELTSKQKKRLEYLELKLSVIKEFDKYDDIENFYSFISSETEYESVFNKNNEELKDSFMWDRLYNVKQKAKIALDAFYENKKKKSFEYAEMAFRHAKEDYEYVIGSVKNKYDL